MADDEEQSTADRIKAGIKKRLGRTLNETVDGLDQKLDTRSQLRSVIQWNDPQPEHLFYRWTENGDEIKNASKLIVGPGQGCLFVYQGRVEAVHTQEGLHELKTANIPFWTTITRVLQMFESEHKVGLYFFRTAEILNCRWGTATVIKYVDPVYRFPVGLKAHGNYAFRITDPALFFRSVVGGKEIYDVNDIREITAARIGQPLADYLAESKFSYADIDANREEISEALILKLQPLFGALGFAITDFRVEGTGFDNETMQRINRIADVQAEVQAAEAAGINYTEMQKLEALREAARNEGGVAGAGVGIGAGIGLGQMLGGNLGATPSSPPKGAHAKLQELKQLHDDGLITGEEYESKRRAILDSM